MDFTLSKEHEILRKMYREFAQNEVKPLAQEIDEEERDHPQAGKAGPAGHPVPQEVRRRRRRQLGLRYGC